MDEIKLSTNLVNAILQYLGNQRWIDVSGLINGIQQEAQAQGAQPAQAPVAPAEAPAEAPAQ